MNVFKTTLIAAAVASLLSPLAAQAADTDFDNFTPLSSSSPANPVGSPLEATPFTLSNATWTQVAVDSNTPAAGRRGDNWDMTTANETGTDAGRYLFSPYETGSAGVKRFDTQTNTSLDIVAPGRSGFVSGDASRWTPWGSYITAEESWGTGSSKGRLFEITNPVSTTGDASTFFEVRDVIPHVSHEGLTFDKDNNLYFIDELNGGSIYKYTSTNPLATNGSDYFAAGQTFALKVGAGSNSNAAGAFSWEAITNVKGGPLASTFSALLDDRTMDGRLAADLVQATEYQRPEDLEIRTLADGSQQLFVATTTTHDVWTIDLGMNTINQFVTRNTIDEATGLAVGNALTNPDNLAIDAEGNMYIIEDQPGGQADIWFARDADKNGVAESVARWASMNTTGAEPTGLYFDKFDPNVAYVNVQHPDSDVDRLIKISTPSAVPVPGAVWLFGSALAGFIARARRKA